MTDDEQVEPEGQPSDDPTTIADPPPPRALKPPGRDSEKALGLEVARLFGLNPRDLVSRPSRPAAPSTPKDEEAADGASEGAADASSGD